VAHRERRGVEPARVAAQAHGLWRFAPPDAGRRRGDVGGEVALVEARFMRHQSAGWQEIESAESVKCAPRTHFLR
jgi:hypothetical protein